MNIINLYSFLNNHTLSRFDQKGLKFFEFASDITWDDFQGEVPNDPKLRGPRVAETVLLPPVVRVNVEDIDVSIKSWNDDCVCIYAKADRATWRFRFSEKRSWATTEAKKSWQTLAHEHAHINIYLNTYKTVSIPGVEVCATTYDEAKDAAVKAIRGERTSLLKSCWKKQDERNNTFDEETEHGLIKENEDEWEETLNSEMQW